VACASLMYPAKSLLTGRELRQLRTQALEKSLHHQEQVAHSEAALQKLFRPFGENPRELTQQEFINALESLDTQVSRGKLAEMAAAVTDTNGKVSSRALSQGLVGSSEYYPSNSNVPLLREILFKARRFHDSGDIIFHRADASDVKDAPLTARKHRTQRWADHGDIVSWGDKSSDSPTTKVDSRLASKASTPRSPSTPTIAQRRAKPVGHAPMSARSADAAAGCTSARLKAEAFVYEPDHNRVRRTPRCAQQAQLRRQASWQDVTGVMPVPMADKARTDRARNDYSSTVSSAPAKILHPKFSPPPPPPPKDSPPVSIDRQLVLE